MRIGIKPHKNLLNPPLEKEDELTTPQEGI